MAGNNPTGKNQYSGGLSKGTVPQALKRLGAKGFPTGDFRHNLQDMQQRRGSMSTAGKRQVLAAFVRRIRAGKSNWAG